MSKAPKPTLSHRDFMTLIRKSARQRSADNRACNDVEREIYRQCVKTHGKKVADGGRAIIALANELGGGWSGTLVQLEVAMLMFRCVVSAMGELLGYKDTPKPEAGIVAAIHGEELVRSAEESRKP